MKIKKIKYRLIKFLARKLLGEFAGNMPLNAVRTLVEGLETSEIKDHLRGYEIYQPTLIEKYNFPIDYPSYFRREKAYDNRYVYKLKNVIVSPSSGLCWIEERKIFLESVGSLQRVMGWGGNYVEIVKPVSCKEKTEIICFPDTGYFHWLLEILPAFINQVKKTNNINVLVSNSPSKYQLDVLNILISGKNQNIIIRSDKPVKVGNYIMTSIEPYSGFVTKSDLQILKETFLPLIEKGSEKTKIYISRRGNNKRRLSNEKELEDELQKLGFQIVRLEEYNFLEQVEIIHSAFIIIAPHGAGLANLVFAEKGTNAIEIFPHWLFNDCFARLSLNNSLNYSYLRSEYDKESAGLIPIQQVINLAKVLCT